MKHVPSRTDVKPRLSCYKSLAKLFKSAGSSVSLDVKDVLLTGSREPLCGHCWITTASNVHDTKHMRTVVLFFFQFPLYKG
jgi:hypothetical protein